MPSTADIAFWALIAVADLFVAYIFVLWGVAREFRWLTVYFACRVLASVVEYVFLWNSGWDSWTYAYVYYIADAILQVILFASVGELVLRSARKSRIARQLVPLFMAAVFLAAIFSSSIMPLSIIFGTGENLFWLSAVVVVASCVWNFFQSGPQYREWVIAFRLGNVMGLYFVVWAAVAALRYLTNGENTLGAGYVLAAAASVWLPIGSSLAAMSVPQSS